MYRPIGFCQLNTQTRSLRASPCPFLVTIQSNQNPDFYQHTFLPTVVLHISRIIYYTLLYFTSLTQHYIHEIHPYCYMQFYIIIPIAICCSINYKYITIYPLYSFLQCLLLLMDFGLNGVSRLLVYICMRFSWVYRQKWNLQVLEYASI